MTRMYIKMITLFIGLWVLLAVTAFPVSALPMPAAEKGRVFDPAELLTPDEETALSARMEALSAEYRVELYFATYRADHVFDDYLGDKYCAEIRNLRSEDAVLLIVTYDELYDEYFYDMYTYGRADRRISGTEVDYILDKGAVYNNLKSGRVAEGSEAFFEWSGKAYEGRVGVSYAIIIPVCAVIGLLIGWGVCCGVSASYKRKHSSVDYPLDRFAKLDLTSESDTFVTKTVTRSRVPRSNASGGGGSSSHGGGGGHRGGR